jgi:hypothetical protein
MLLWSKDMPNSIAQIQKSYDWTIAQWSGIATATLTAILTLLAGAAVEALKGTVVAATPLIVTVIVGVLLFSGGFAMCNYEITMLKNEFLTLYGLLAGAK